MVKANYSLLAILGLIAIIISAVIFLLAYLNLRYKNNLENQVTTSSPQISDYTIPSVGTSFDWQLSSEVTGDRISDVMDVDLFDVTENTVSKLHRNDVYVICYINVGASEDWRIDKDQFALSVIGKDYEGWEGERWLDIRSESVKKIMQSRIDLAKEKNCDGIEPDNIDGYNNDTGFPITYENQLDYNIWLAKEAHSRGLSIGLKNDEEQIQELVDFFDWALTEDCFDEGWCDSYDIFIEENKAVFMVEYTDTQVDFDEVCIFAQDHDFTAIQKHRDLDQWSKTCISESQSVIPD